MGFLSLADISAGVGTQPSLSFMNLHIPDLSNSPTIRSSAMDPIGNNKISHQIRFLQEDFAHLAHIYIRSDGTGTVPGQAFKQLHTAYKVLSSALRSKLAMYALELHEPPDLTPTASCLQAALAHTNGDIHAALVRQSQPQCEYCPRYPTLSDQHRSHSLPTSGSTW